MTDGNDVVILGCDEGGFLVCERPDKVLDAASAAEVGAVLAEVERWTDGGGVAAGFLAYEAAAAFDGALTTHEPAGLPVAWFGLYPHVHRVNTLPPGGSCQLGDWLPSIERSDYEQALARIRAYLLAGDTYQVNFSYRLNAAFKGDPYGLFRMLQQAQPSPHCAYVRTGRLALCSASPELFFSLSRGALVSRPMKGTARRGLWVEDDLGRAEALRQSPKNRAENVMIVDMIRNDMGRVARPGTVRVTRECEVERYPTVWQMTSTVRSRTRAGWRPVLDALFPCASITGAPKVRTMEIIRELEPTPRGIYTGAIGMMGPGKRARFNVAIRTVAIDMPAGRAEFGVGGGVVWDSTVGDEYRECLAKAAVLGAAPPAFDLLETLLWRPGRGYFLLEYHLRRLMASARYFQYAVNRGAVRERLRREALNFGGSPRRVRLLAGHGGGIRIESSDLAPSTRPWRVAMASEPVRSGDRFLYHKTTQRAVYEVAAAEHPDCDDVILHNERGEITEATKANVVVVLNGRHLTPPVSCGLLGGTYREYLLKQGKLEEAVIPLDRLNDADDVYLINSVWGKIKGAASAFS